MKAAEWIDQVSQAMDGASDYRIAKTLGISHATISRYRNGGGTLDTEVCVKVAQVLGIEPLRVIADQEEQRARTPAKRRWWHQIATAAAVILSVALPGKKPEASMTYSASLDAPGIYIMRTIRRMAHALLAAARSVDFSVEGIRHAGRALAPGWLATGRGCALA